MQISLEKVRSTPTIADNDQRWKESVILPCSQCGEPTRNNAAAVTILGLTNKGCACNKCFHANICFEFRIEFEKAGGYIAMLERSDDKRREARILAASKIKEVAQNIGQQCCDNFMSRYGHEWQKQMAKIRPAFDMDIKNAQGSPRIYFLVQEARAKGFCEKIAF